MQNEAQYSAVMPAEVVKGPWRARLWLSDQQPMDVLLEYQMLEMGSGRLISCFCLSCLQSKCRIGESEKSGEFEDHVFGMES